MSFGQKPQLPRALRFKIRFLVSVSAITFAYRLYALLAQFKCCGYFDGTDLAEIGGNYCTSQEFVNALESTNINNFCVTPVTSFADSTLQNIFT